MLLPLYTELFLFLFHDDMLIQVPAKFPHATLFLYDIFAPYIHDIFLCYIFMQRKQKVFRGIDDEGERNTQGYSKARFLAFFFSAVGSK